MDRKKFFENTATVAVAAMGCLAFLAGFFCYVAYLHGSPKEGTGFPHPMLHKTSDITVAVLFAVVGVGVFLRLRIAALILSVLFLVALVKIFPDLYAGFWFYLVPLLLPAVLTIYAWSFLSWRLKGSNYSLQRTGEDARH